MTARTRRSSLDRLDASEAQETLRRLLEGRPSLRKEAEDIAKSMLAGSDFEEVADDVEDAVRSADVEELYGRAGRHEWGYVEPGEAATEMVEEELSPFLEDMKRRIELGHEAAALELCKGILLGLYRLRREKSHEVLACAPDCPAEFAGTVLVDWHRLRRKSRPSGRGRDRGVPFPKGFAAEFLPEWRDLVARASRRERRASP